MTIHLRTKVAICGAFTILSAPGLATVEQPSSVPPAKPPTLSERVATLEARVEFLTKVSTELLTKSLKTLMPKEPGSEPVMLDCDTHKYSEVHAKGSGLVFLVSCVDIEGYLEGHKVNVTIGNPYFVGFHGLKGAITYAGVLRAEMSSSKELRAGYWNDVTIIINPSTASDMAMIGFEMTVDTASLATAMQ